MLLYVMCYMSISCILRYVTLPGAEGPNASPFGELAEVPSGAARAMTGPPEICRFLGCFLRRAGALLAPACCLPGRVISKSAIGAFCAQTRLPPSEKLLPPGDDFPNKSLYLWKISNKYNNYAGK